MDTTDGSVVSFLPDIVNNPFVDKSKKPQKKKPPLPVPNPNSFKKK